VSVLTCCQVVLALFKDIGLVTVRVILCEITSCNRHGESLGRTGSENLGLVVNYKLNRSCLNAGLLIILGVGLLKEDLNRLLTCNVTDISYSYADVVLIGLGIVGNDEIGILKLSVGEAVAEGIGYCCRVVEVACITLAHYLVLISGLGVSVAHVDTLLVYYVAILRAAVCGNLVAVCVIVNEAGVAVKAADLRLIKLILTVVCVYGVKIVVLPEGVGELTRGICLTCKDVGNTNRALGTDTAAVKNCVNAILGIVNEVKHYLVGKVAENDDLVVLTCILCLLEALENRSLVLVKGEVVAVEGIKALAVVEHLVIGTLTADTGENEYSCLVAVNVLYAVGNFVPGCLVDVNDGVKALAIEMNSAVVAGLVPIIKLLVYREACLLEAVKEIGDARLLRIVLTVTRNYGVNRGCGEEAHLFARCKRKSVVVVLEKNSTLLHNELSEILTVCLQVKNVCVVRLEVLGVKLLVSAKGLVLYKVEAVLAEEVGNNCRVGHRHLSTYVNNAVDENKDNEENSSNN